MDRGLMNREVVITFDYKSIIHRLVTGSKDTTVRVWNIQTGACLRTLDGHTDSVTDVAYDGVTIISTSDDNTVRIWRAPFDTDACVLNFDHHVMRLWLSEAPHNMAIMFDTNRSVHVHDIHTGGCMYVSGVAGEKATSGGKLFDVARVDLVS